MAALDTLLGRVDDLSLRERGIVLGGIILVIYFLVDTMVFQPLNTNQKQVQNQITRTNAEISALNVRLGQLLTSSSSAQEEQKKARIQQLRNELSRLDLDLQQTTANLVTPQQMTRLLQMVLAQTDGLHLRKVTGLGSSPLVLGNESATGPSPDSPVEAETGASTAQPAVTSAYKHGLQIEFDGNFFSTLDYLKKLEELEWNFFWDKIEFEVSEYPDATVILTLYTISLDKNWIGV